jgi:hypothetical protein
MQDTLKTLERHKNIYIGTPSLLGSNEDRISYHVTLGIVAKPSLIEEGWGRCFKSFFLRPGCFGQFFKLFGSVIFAGKDMCKLY